MHNGPSRIRSPWGRTRAGQWLRRTTLPIPAAACAMPRTTSSVVTRLDSGVASPPMSNRYPTPCSETTASKAIEGRPSRSRRKGARIAARPRALSAGRRDSSSLMAIAHSASARGSTRWVYCASSPAMASRAPPGDALSSRRHPTTSKVAECWSSARTEVFGEEDRPDTGPERSSAATAGPRIQIVTGPAAAPYR